MGSGPGGKNISASRVLPSLKAAPAAARSIPSMSVARSGKAAQAVAAVSAATPVSGSRRHRSRTMGHQVEAGPERIRRHRRRTHAPGRDPVMKTPETPFIGPRPRQSFAPRKVRPCGRSDAGCSASQFASWDGLQGGGEACRPGMRHLGQLPQFRDSSGWS